MSLETLSNLLKSAKLYETGYLSLISSTGLKAVDYDLALEDQIDSDFENGETQKQFQKASQNLQVFRYNKIENGKNFLKIFKTLKIQDAQEIWFLGVNVPVHEVKHSVKYLRALIIGSFIIALFITILVTLIIIKKIVRELNIGVGAMKNIAQGDGDLTVRMKIKHETELDQMYTYFNETMEKIQGSISQVKNASTELENQGRQLADSMNDTAAAANEITANIESVNRQIQQQGSEVHSATDSVVSINSNVKELISNIQTQSANVTESSAGIEAAHAGEAGKGFSVVADEIRKLAEDSNKQGKIITSNLQNTLDSASNSVTEQMNHLMRLTEEITSSMEEMALGMESINSSINVVNDLTHQNTKSIEDLGHAVNKFKVN